MNEQVEQPTSPKHKPWYRHEFFFFIAASIAAAFMLVVVSIILYTSSGASLLDLSRPGYKSVQSEVDQSDSFEAFSSDGPVTKQALDQFQALYHKQVNSVITSNDFDTTPLSDAALGIDDVPPIQPQQ